MSLKPYPEYKNSRVELLGSVPAEWVVTRLGSALELKKVLVGTRSDDFLLLSLTMRGVIPRDMENRMGKLPADFTTYQAIERDDIVFCLFDVEETPRTVGWVPQPGMVTGAYTAAAVRKEFYSPFVAYYYLSFDQYKSFSGYYAGLRNTIRSKDFANIPMVMPSLNEQFAIAVFLDRETAEIDAFIADQEELIALLNERRAATITQAVTKGLDPDAPMKDSGFSWLGQIPRQWDVQKLKSLVAMPITDGPHETPELYTDGVPFVSAEAISSGVVNFEKIRGFISVDDHHRFSRKYSPMRNDIYMIKSGATTGVCAMVETDKDFSIWSPLAAIRCGHKAIPRFVLHAMRSRNFQESVRLFWNYGTQQNIGMKVLENLPIPLPSRYEQMRIADYLDKEVAEINLAISDAERAIELSKERRAALISAAVTGKIDVRDTVASKQQPLEGELVVH